jgi:hypothetical protein
LPGAEITLVALPFVRELVARSPHLDRFMPFPGFPGIAGRAVDLAGRISLPVLGAVLVRCGVPVTNDSGPVHVAYARGAPSVIVFGDTDPARWGSPTGGPRDRGRARRHSPGRRGGGGGGGRAPGTGACQAARVADDPVPVAPDLRGLDLQ